MRQSAFLKESGGGGGESNDGEIGVGHFPEKKKLLVLGEGTFHFPTITSDMQDMEHEVHVEQRTWKATKFGAPVVACPPEHLGRVRGNYHRTRRPSRGFAAVLADRISGSRNARSRPLPRTTETRSGSKNACVGERGAAFITVKLNFKAPGKHENRHLLGRQ